MKTRTKRTIITYVMVAAFLATLINIKIVNKYSKDDETKRWMRLVLPCLAMAFFFVGCYLSAVTVAAGESTGKDRFAGIVYMSIIGIILIVLNMTILNYNNVTSYIKGKKFHPLGMIMTAGVGAIIFGFLDNFGMKLGTDAMDNSFLQAFLGPFSIDNRFTKYQPNIKKNLEIMNQWVVSDWRRVVNHTLRFQNDIAKIPKFKDLSNAINKFGGKKLDVPASVLTDRSLTNDYVDNLRTKFDLIDGSKAMMGNTFSDCIGALLGAGIISLFVYMTCYDGTVVSKEYNEDSYVVKYFGYYAPIMEAVCIGFGCLVPVFLNIAMSNMQGSRNSFWCWVIIFIISAIVFSVMFMSAYFVEDMTLDDKKYSVKKTLEGLTERIDLKENKEDIGETQFYNSVKQFMDAINV